MVEDLVHQKTYILRMLEIEFLLKWTVMIIFL